MSDKPENPPAFPTAAYEGIGGAAIYQGGMTLRDYFAAKAEVPWNAVLEMWKLNRQIGTNDPTVEQLLGYRSQLKYVEADAMLAERSKS
jgi:hypothetical protein